MTRREREIIEEAEKHMYDWGVDVDRFDVPDIFAKGAEWMQKTMIEKVCEYAQSKYDLDFCGDVKDILNYLKSLVEE